MSCPSHMRVSVTVRKGDKPLGVQAMATCIAAGTLTKTTHDRSYHHGHPRCGCPSRTAETFKLDAADFSNRLADSTCKDLGQVVVDAIDNGARLFTTFQQDLKQKPIETTMRRMPGKKNWGQRSWVAMGVERVVRPPPIVMDLTSAAIESVQVEYSNRATVKYSSPSQIMFAVEVSNHAATTQWPSDWVALTFLFCAGTQELGSLERLSDKAQTTLQKLNDKVKTSLQTVSVVLNWLNRYGVTQELAASTLSHTGALARMGSWLVDPEGPTAEALSYVFTDVKPLLSNASQMMSTAANVLDNQAVRHAFLSMSICMSGAVSTYIYTATRPGITTKDRIVDIAFGVLLAAMLLGVMFVWYYGAGLQVYLASKLASASFVYGPQIAAWLLSMGNLAFLAMSIIDIVRCILGMAGEKESRLKSFFGVVLKAVPHLLNFTSIGAPVAAVASLRALGFLMQLHGSGASVPSVAGIKEELTKFFSETVNEQHEHIKVTMMGKPPVRGAEYYNQIRANPADPGDGIMADFLKDEAYYVRSVEEATTTGLKKSNQEGLERIRNLIDTRMSQNQDKYGPPQRTQADYNHHATETLFAGINSFLALSSLYAYFTSDRRRGRTPPPATGDLRRYAGNHTPSNDLFFARRNRSRSRGAAREKNMGKTARRWLASKK